MRGPPSEGGNTANLLALWRVHGLDRLLRDAWASGAILAGISAGMNCWFDASTTDSFGGLGLLADGLGLVPGSACPHYDGESERRPHYHRALLDGFPAGYAVQDGAALHFVGRELVGAVASRPDARAYRVEVRDGQVVEEAIPTRFSARGFEGAPSTSRRAARLSCVAHAQVRDLVLCARAQALASSGAHPSQSQPYN